MAIGSFVLGTDYRELPGARLYIDGGKLRGDRKFHILDYSRYPEFIVALAGGVSHNGADVTRIPPASYGHNVNGVFCKSASHQGVGAISRLSNGDEYFYGGAFIDVHYETLDYDPTTGGNPHGNDPNNPTPGPYMTESGSTSAQVLTRTKTADDGSAAWQWLSGAKVTGDSAPDIVAHEVLKSYTLTRHNVPAYPKDLINGLVGKVNHEVFPPTSSAGAFPAETLKFDGDDFQRETFSDGSTNGWTIVLRFTYNRAGWNRLFNPSTGAYEKVLRVADTTQSICELGDFTTLLET